MSYAPSLGWGPHFRGRWSTPDDLIGVAVFLASPASDYVNGQIIYVDGGVLAVIRIRES
jgi:NAD(P)-dependent dehydrogenase (short-subunit alcohol dehydrogenase family)